MKAVFDCGDILFCVLGDCGSRLHRNVDKYQFEIIQEADPGTGGTQWSVLMPTIDLIRFYSITLLTVSVQT